EAIYLQEKMMQEWQRILTTIEDKISQDEKLLDISLILEQTSQEMAQERRNKRNQYFERSVANETQLDLAVSKVEALLWIDRLVYHYWRATARMAEFQSINEDLNHKS
ncbi:MAG: Na/Pi cotransporter family protein, partial [Solibacillus sp.]